MVEDMAAQLSDEETILFSCCKKARGFLLTLYLLSSFFFGISCFSRKWSESVAVITLFAGLMATIIRIARNTINPRRQVPASIIAFYTNPTLQKTRTPFPIIPAISPILGTAPDNAIDDALARTPAPTRNNSPLSWL